MASVDFAAIARDVATEMMTKEVFNAMTSQNMLVVVDSKGRHTQSENEFLIHTVRQKGIAENVAELARFIRNIDEYLLYGISGPRNASKMMHTQWCRTNAKILKTLAKLLTRKEKRKKVCKKGLTLKKPLRKRKADKVDLVKTGSAAAPLASSSAVAQPNFASAPLVSSSADAKRVRIRGKTAKSNETTDVGSDDVELHIMASGAEVIEVSNGDVTCLACGCKITPEDSVNISAAGVSHQHCRLAGEVLKESTKVSALDPRHAIKAKAIVKGASKQKKQHTAKFGNDTVKALARHEALTKIAKPLQVQGGRGDNKWRARYEPIKAKTWAVTKHQVVFRWVVRKTSKTIPFEYNEETEPDSVFEVALKNALDKVISEEMST